MFGGGYRPPLSARDESLDGSSSVFAVSAGLAAGFRIAFWHHLRVEIAGRKVLVIGAARSGIASARFLAQRGAIVALNDRKPVAEWAPGALNLKTEGVGCIEGDPPSWLLDQISLVVVSPGVAARALPSR